MGKFADGRGWDNDGSIAFSQFAVWFSSIGFSENLTLSSEEQRLRHLCRKHDMSFVDVDKYKSYFDRFDFDGDGQINEAEFATIVMKCAKVPPQVQIPPARMLHFFH